MKKRGVGLYGRLRKDAIKSENLVLELARQAEKFKTDEDTLRLWLRLERKGEGGRLGRALIPDRMKNKIVGYVFKPRDANEVYAEAEADYEATNAIRHAQNRQGIQSSFSANTGKALKTGLNIKALIAAAE